MLCCSCSCVAVILDLAGEEGLETKGEGAVGYDGDDDDTRRLNDSGLCSKGDVGSKEGVSKDSRRCCCCCCCRGSMSLVDEETHGLTLGSSITESSSPPPPPCKSTGGRLMRFEIAELGRPSGVDGAVMADICVDAADGGRRDDCRL